MPALPVRLSAYSRVRFIFCIKLTRYGRGGIHDASPQAGRTLHPRRAGVMNAAPTSVVERDRLPLCTKMNRTHYLHVSVQNMSRMVYCEARTGKPPAFCISYAGYNYITTDGRAIGMSLHIPRRTYADLYGPTTGDRVRLADTELIVEVEEDFAVPGDEITFGGGKVIRDGRIVNIGQAGDPEIMAGVQPELVLGAATDVVAGENLIVTAGAIDSHI